jgi:hypothetical protein
MAADFAELRSIGSLFIISQIKVTPIFISQLGVYNARQNLSDLFALGECRNWQGCPLEQNP